MIVCVKGGCMDESEEGGEKIMKKEEGCARRGLISRRRVCCSVLLGEGIKLDGREERV